MLMNIPFLDYITPRVFPKISRDHRLKASRTIINLRLIFKTQSVPRSKHSLSRL